MILEKRICDAYRLGRLVSSSVAGGSRNTCYVFHTSTGQWFARRRHADYCDEKRVQFDHQAMFHFACSGVPVKPPLVSAAGNTWWRADDALWEVFEFVEGRHMRDGAEADTALLGTVLGKFHRAGSGFMLRYEKMGARGETDPERLSLNAKRLRNENPETGPVLEPYERLIAQSSHDLPPDAYRALPHTLVHGDVQPANVLMGEDGVRAFVDFDWCAWRPRIYDLAFAILCCCSSHEQPVGKGDIWALTQAPYFNAEATKSFLDAYEESAGALSGDEKKWLKPQIALTWCHTRIDGAFKVSREERRNFLSRPIPEDSFFHNAS
ncbi:MAG: phosphotransferase [Kiritimatiellaeota bacterium]|nr:phosphotransferase [Kiritimatiellota bacterium]